MTHCAATRLWRSWRMPGETRQVRRPCWPPTSLSMCPAGLPPLRSVRRNFRMHLRISTCPRHRTQSWNQDEASTGFLSEDRFMPPEPQFIAPSPHLIIFLYRRSSFGLNPPQRCLRPSEQKSLGVQRIREDRCGTWNGLCDGGGSAKVPPRLTQWVAATSPPGRFA